MRRLVEIGDLLVYPVGRHDILYEVVRPYGEEVGFFCQDVCGERGRRDFYHGPDLHLFIERDGFFLQGLLHVLQYLVCRLQLLYPGYHGIHKFQFAVIRGPQDSPKLDLEYIRPRQAESDGAPSHEGVHLRRDLELRQELVPSQVERPDYDRVGFYLLRDDAVGLELLLFAGQVLAVHVDKFRPVQAYSLRAVRDHGRHVLRQFYIGGKFYLPLIQSLARQVLELLQVFLADLYPLLLRGVFLQGLLRRVYYDQAVHPVHYDAVSVPDPLRHDLKPHDRRYLQRLRHDGRVRRPSSYVRGKADDVLLVHGRGVRRG